MTMTKSKAPSPPTGGSDSSTESLPPDAAGAPMHSSDAIISLRVAGTSHEFVLPFSRSFRLGTGAEVEVRIPAAVAARKVSREHARLTRAGSSDATWLRVVDLGSTNGTSFNGVRQTDFAVSAGQRFKVATTELIVMDKVLVGLRRALGTFFGFDQHERLDDYLTLLHVEPLVLLGDRGAERGHLADALHRGSSRRHRRFVEIDDPEQGRGALTALVEKAAGGTVFVSLDRLRQHASLAPLIGLVFNRQYDVHPTFAARSLKEARTVLNASADLFRPVTIPAIKERKEDIPALLDTMLEEQGSPHRVAELGSDRVAAMREYAWPRNRVELRETAARIAPLLAHGGNLSAAAAAIEQDYETYRRALARVGAIAVRHRG
jgi:hypothetical protein